MIVSDSKSFVFVHNPKAAGTSVRKILDPYRNPGTDYWGFRLYPPIGRIVDIAHTPLDVLLQIQPDLIMKLQAFNSFGFVRHPVQRYFSAVHQFLRNFTSDLNSKIVLADKELFDRYVDRFALTALNRDGVELDYRFAHFIPQKRFFFIYNVQLVKAFKIEELASLPPELTALGLSDIGQENSSNLDLKVGGLFDQSALSPAALRKILEFYAEDFDHFGYSA